MRLCNQSNENIQSKTVNAKSTYDFAVGIHNITQSRLSLKFYFCKVKKRKRKNKNKRERGGNKLKTMPELRQDTIEFANK